MITLTAVLEESRRLGFLGPGPVEPHITHAEAFADAVDSAPARALDLGAGGGLPGLVLAVSAWPTTRWIFLDSQRKRTDFLRWAIEELDLADRIRVVTERAELAGRDEELRGRQDLVTSRSFGPPAVTAECAAPLLRRGGLLVVSEPPEADGARWPDDGLAMVGLSAPDHLRVGASDHPVHLVRMRLDGEVADRFPRRVGIPTKRPIF